MSPPAPARTLALVMVLTSVACSESSDPTSPAEPRPEMGILASTAQAPDPSLEFELSAPVFGLTTVADGSLLVTEAFTGLSEIRKGTASLVAEIPFPTGVAAMGRGDAFVVSGQPPEGIEIPGSRALYRASRGTVRLVADLWAFEQDVNPDQVWNDGEPDSNPFNVEMLGGGSVLVADAAANAILVVDRNGRVDWVAVLPPEPLPFMGGEIPAQPVATSVAVGPDGAYYAGELKGFPGTPGNSRVWRIEAGTRRTVCPSDACVQVLDGLTSIVDLAFGPDGTLYVVELDAAGWLATETEAGIVPADGGRVQACDVGAGTCTALAEGLDLPAAITVGADGTIWIAENGSIPGTARVRALDG